MRLPSRLRETVAASAIVACLAAAPIASAQTANGEDGSEASIVEPYWGDIAAFWGDIAAFEGGVNPFWGDIAAFWGDIAAFEGDISPYWGDIAAFWGDIAAFEDGVHPFWGDIAAFWGDPESFDGSIAPLWGDIAAFWGDIAAFEDDPETFYALQGKFHELVARSEAFWGDAVTAETGKSFIDGFAAGVFAKHGIDLKDPSTFEGFSNVEKARFFFDWYDGLMSFSGRDHVDHWMGTANWTPAMTQERGSGEETVIGVIDFNFAADSDLYDNVVRSGGTSDENEGHGTAVASLLVASHDGNGVMGIAPRASVVAYDPFDESGTASWDDIVDGLHLVTSSGAHVVNMSLGVPGATLHEGWADLYSRADIALLASNTLFVHAAGNEGLEQTHDIDWNHLFDPSMLVVGSVGPTGVISPFSNTPGEACLLNSGVCYEENKLKYRFLVAPGEWILVSDGKGAVTRRSGTSFAAPIVSGAIALQFDRWSWLTDHPDQVVNIILSTATDLGDPGVDGVYGHGLLNIGRSLEPLDEDNLYILSPTGNKDPLNAVSSAEQLLWNATDGEITAFEDIGDTYRDFSVPLNTVLAGTTMTASSTADALETYVDDTVGGLVNNLLGGLGGGKGKKRRGLFLAEGAMPNEMGWDMSFALAPSSANLVGVDNELPYAGEVSITSLSNVTMRFGAGMGAMSLAGQRGFSNESFNPYTGGANPVLGLASGGAFGKFEFPLQPGLRFDVGMSQRTFENDRVMPFSGEVLALHQTVKPYEAKAANLSLVKDLGERVSLNAGYTYLTEAQGLLGVQSLNPSTFNEGAQADAASIGMDWSLSDRITFSSSATLGRTRTQNTRQQLLTVGENGVTTSAFEAAMSFTGVFDGDDAARIALIQPMHVETGGLNISSSEVVDRQTGQLGETVTFTPIDGQARKLALEAVYARSTFNGRGQVSAFVRGEANTAVGHGGDTVQMIGGALSIGF